MHPDVAQRRFGQYALVATGVLAATLLGLVAQALIVSYLGAGRRSDALFMARDIMQSGAKLLLPSQAAGVLVPMFLAMRRRSGPEAWSPLAAVFTTMLAVAAPIALVIVAAAPQLVALFAPGFDDSTAALTAALLRIVAPSIVFALAGTLATAILQGEQRFSRATFANVASGLALVVGLISLTPSFGARGAAFSLLGASVVQATIAWAVLMREGMPALADPRQHLGYLRDFWASLVVLVPYGAAVQVSGIVLRASASLLAPGLFTSLSLARQVNMALFALVFMPLNSVMFTALSRHTAEGLERDFRAELRASIRQAIYLVTPVSVAIVVLREPAVSMVFERGAFGAAATADTAIPVAIYSAGLLLTGTYMLLEQAAYARRNPQLVVRTNLRMEGLQIMLFPLLTVLLGVAGIPLASIPVALFGTFYYLRHLFPAQRVKLNRHARFLGAVGAAATTMAIVTAVAAWGIDLLIDPGPGLPQALVVVPASLIGVATYFGASLALGVRELRLLLPLITAPFRRDGGA